MAALVGVPVYASTAVLLPLGALLLDQGVGLGIVTAFLMGATGFSVPEGLMLKEIIGTRRVAVLTLAFAGAVVVAGSRRFKRAGRSPPRGAARDGPG